MIQQYLPLSPYQTVTVPVQTVWAAIPRPVHVSTIYRHCQQINTLFIAWNAWTIWTTCTVTCGGGLHSRFRDCLDNDGITVLSYASCGLAGSGDESNFPCNSNSCPGETPLTVTVPHNLGAHYCISVDGGWSVWGSWTGCIGISLSDTRSRYCTAPMPSHGGSNCVGNATQSISCPC